jgi:tetratricopeptide (TPR) repeat protein
MVQHQAFFEVLSTTEPDTPAWTSTIAGLALLGLVDAAREDASIVDSDWTGVRAVVDGVGAIRDGSPLRRPLTGVIDELRGERRSWTALNASLFAYGKALDLEGSWKLAVDVFATVAEIARAENEPEVAIEATTALGGSARRSGDWDRSAESYAEAAHLANALGDKASGLTIRVGTANTHIARGNLPAAQQIFDEVIAESEKSGLDGVAALAYHGSASVAHQTGRFADAVRLANSALERTTNAGVRDTIMSDLAAAFMGLGMHGPARDAYLVVSMTSQYQWVRWQAGINLMELASIDGMETAFDDYAKQLRNAALDPRLRSYFLLYYGEGCARLGRLDEGLKYIAEAKEFASGAKIHQVAFDAEKAMASARSKAKDTNVAPTFIPADVQEIAGSLARKRELAAAEPR